MVTSVYKVLNKWQPVLLPLLFSQHLKSFQEHSECSMTSLVLVGYTELDAAAFRAPPCVPILSLG